MVKKKEDVSKAETKKEDISETQEIEIVEPPVEAKEPESVEEIPGLAEYVAIWQERAEAMNLSMVAVQHPAAVNGSLFAGKYSGVRQVKGPEVKAQLSTGEWFK